MRLPTYLLACLSVAIFAFLTVDRLLEHPAPGTTPQQWLMGLLLLGVIPLLLWVGLLQGHQFAWWVLVLYCGGIAIADFRTATATPGGIATQLPQALFFTLSFLLLATDPPIKWVARNWPQTLLSWVGVHHEQQQAGGSIALSKEEQEARTAFHVWWQAKTRDDRLQLWRRLEEQERKWALECMPQDEIDACMRVVQ